MRTLMMLASVAMIGSGIFCIANGTAAFLTVAFIIGLVFMLLGAIEIHDAVVGYACEPEEKLAGIGVLPLL